MARMEKRRIEMPDGDVVLFPAFFSSAQSDLLLESLRQKIAWKQESVNMFGRTVDIPRLTAWYGDQGVEYSYSGITHQPLAWTADLLEIKARVERVAGTPLNVFTRSVGWPFS